MKNLDTEIERYQKFNESLDKELERDKLVFAGQLKKIKKEEIFVKSKKEPIWKRIIKLLMRS
jgi:hypothetical protein